METKPKEKPCPKYRVGINLDEGRKGCRGRDYDHHDGQKQKAAGHQNRGERPHDCGLEQRLCQIRRARGGARERGGARSSWHADCYVESREVNGMFWNQEEVRGSYLAKGLRFVGDVLGAGDFVCDGEVEGRIEIDGLVQVDSGGKIHGCIEATEAD